MEDRTAEVAADRLKRALGWSFTALAFFSLGAISFEHRGGLETATFFAVAAALLPFALKEAARLQLQAHSGVRQRLKVMATGGVEFAGSTSLVGMLSGVRVSVFLLSDRGGEQLRVHLCHTALRQLTLNPTPDAPGVALSSRRRLGMTGPALLALSEAQQAEWRALFKERDVRLRGDLLEVTWPAPGDLSAGRELVARWVALVALLDSGSRHHAQALLARLREQYGATGPGDPEVERLLLALLRDHPRALQAEEALGLLAGDAPPEALEGWLRDLEAPLPCRLAAAWRLGERGHAPALPALLAGLEDPSPLALLCAQALGQLGAPAAIRPLVGALERDDPALREEVIAALELCGDAWAGAALAHFARRLAPRDRAAAARAQKAADRLEARFGKPSGRAGALSVAAPPEGAGALSVADRPGTGAISTSDRPGAGALSTAKRERS